MVAGVEEIVLPDGQEAASAKESCRRLMPFDGQELRIAVPTPDGNGNQEVTLPASAVHALVLILTEMGEGNAVSLAPVRSEFTTEQAADFLNVSEPYLIDLLDSGKLPSTSQGSSRCIKFTDLAAYREQSDRECERALTELAADAQENGYGY